jgi:hypothetical protein
LTTPSGRKTTIFLANIEAIGSPDARASFHANTVSFVRSEEVAEHPRHRLVGRESCRDLA